MFDYFAARTGDPCSPVERALTVLLERRAGAVEARTITTDDGFSTVVHIPRPCPPVRIPAAPPAPAAAPPSPAPAAAPPSLALLLDTGVERLDAARAADRLIARASARRARELCAFARQRPAAVLDRPPGERGALSAASRAGRPDALTDVSEWAVDEVSVGLCMSRSAANRLLEQSIVLVERLNRTLVHLDDAGMTPAHAAVLIEVLGPIEDDAIRASAEQRLIDRLGRKTPSELRSAARRVVLRLDARAAAERMVRAVRDRHVRLFDGGDGMSAMTAVLAGPVGQACLSTLDALAKESRTDGDERTHAQRMADCLADLILRPAERELPPVQVALTVVAAADTLLGGDEPGEVDGTLVPAEMVRELAYVLGLLPRPAPATTDPVAARPAPADEPGAATEADPASEPETPEPTDPFAGDGEIARRRAEVESWQQRALAEAAAGAADAARLGRWTDGEPRDLLDLAALLTARDTAGTTLAHRPHIAVVDKLRGTLVALTDAAAVSRFEALGPPPDSAGYRPPAALDRFVRLRDRRCRFPGCRQRPRKCDLDHECPWPEGPTAHHNLCCLCETHHRLKHQAPGWEITAIDDDGGLAFRAPSGEVTVTHPPRFGADDDLPPY